MLVTTRLRASRKDLNTILVMGGDTDTNTHTYTHTQKSHRKNQADTHTHTLAHTNTHMHTHTHTHADSYTDKHTQTHRHINTPCQIHPTRNPIQNARPKTFTPNNYFWQADSRGHPFRTPLGAGYAWIIARTEGILASVMCSFWPESTDLAFHMDLFLSCVGVGLDFEAMVAIVIKRLT
jgi:hypothetical protein